MARLAPGEAERLLRERGLTSWRPAGNAIERTVETSGWAETVAIFNAVAALAERMNHHPDLEVGYSRLVVRFWTHSEGGVTEKDIEAAERVEKLLESLKAALG